MRTGWDGKRSVITKTAIEKKSGIVSLTRSNPFAFSYAIGGGVPLPYCKEASR